MVNRFVTSAVEAFLAVMTVTSVGIMTTLHTHSSTDVSWQLVEFHVEATLTRVEVTVARYNTFTHNIT